MKNARPNRFNGKVALVTGAAQGMGKQLCLDMAKEEARIVATDILEDDLAGVEREIREFGGDCITVMCDVSSPQEVDSLVATTMKTYGRLDILVNNAGLLTSATIEDTGDDLIDRTLDINVKGVLYAIRAATPIMKEQGYGRIVNVSSITGKNGDNTTTFVYGASKGAVATLTRSVARQLGPFGVTANAIAPHAVMTKMMSYWTEEKKSSIANRIPVRRLGTVEDMSYLMMFLASDEAGFINGEVVNINGGYYMD